MRIPEDLPPERLALLQPIVDETLDILRQAVSRMPVDTPPAVDFEVET